VREQARRRLPDPVHRPYARFFGYLLIGFSPFPLLLMFVSWGSYRFGHRLVPRELSVVGGLYGLLGLASLTCGIILVARFYRSKEVAFQGRAVRAPTEILAEGEFKRTDMNVVPSQSDDPATELVRVQQALGSLRVQYGMQQIDHDYYVAESQKLTVRARQLQEQLEPEKAANLRRIPDHNRSRRHEQ
jgi:hypothetical protein